MFHGGSAGASPSHRQIDLVVVRNVFIAYTTRDATIGASPKPAPAIVRGGIFRVDGEIKFSGLPQDGARYPEGEFAVLAGHFEIARLFPLAPAPPLPPADEMVDLSRSYFDRQKQIAFEGQEDRRSFKVLCEGENRRADFSMGAERKVDINRIIAGPGRMVSEQDLGAGSRDHDRDIVRTGNRLFAHGYFRHASVLSDETRDVT